MEALAVAILLQAARDGDHDFLNSDFAHVLCDGCKIGQEVWAKVFQELSA